MKIGYSRADDTRYSKPLFVVVSKFSVDSFPVPVRYLRVGQTKVSKTSLGVKGPEKRRIRERERQRKINSIDVVPKSLDVARQVERRPSTSL